jgi:hypothetical protein
LVLVKDAGKGGEKPGTHPPWIIGKINIEKIRKYININNII